MWSVVCDVEIIIFHTRFDDNLVSIKDAVGKLFTLVFVVYCDEEKFIKSVVQVNLVGDFRA